MKSILYKKKIKKFQEGGATFYSVADLYDPAKDYYKQLDASNARQESMANSRSRSRNKPKEEKKEKSIVGKFFTGGPKGTRNALNVAMEFRINSLNEKVRNDKDYLYTAKGANELNGIERFHANKQGFLTNLEKSFIKATNLNESRHGNVVFKNNEYYVLDRKDKKYKNIDQFEFNSNEEKVEGNNRYSRSTVGKVINILNTSALDSDNGYKELIDIRTWDNVVDKVINPKTSKIKPVTIKTSDGANTQGINIDERVNVSTAELLEQFEQLRKTGSVSMTSNSGALGEYFGDIVESVYSNSHSTDALYLKVWQNVENKKKINSFEKKEDKENMLNQLAVQQIYKDTFMAERFKLDLKGLKGDENKDGPLTPAKGEKPIKVGPVGDLYDLTGNKERRDLVIDGKTLGRGHTPTKFIENVQAKEQELAKDKIPGNLYNLNMGTILNFGGMTIAGNENIYSATGTSYDQLLKVSKFGDTSDFISVNVPVNPDNTVNYDFLEYEKEIKTIATDLLSNGIYDLEDPNDLFKLHKNILKSIDSRKDSDKMKKYQQSLLGKTSIDDIKSEEKFSAIIPSKRFLKGEIVSFLDRDLFSDKAKKSSIYIGGENNTDTKTNSLRITPQTIADYAASMGISEDLVDDEWGWGMFPDMSSQEVVKFKVMIPLRDFMSAITRQDDKEYTTIVNSYAKAISKEDTLTLNTLFDKVINSIEK